MRSRSVDGEAVSTAKSRPGHRTPVSRRQVLLGVAAGSVLVLTKQSFAATSSPPKRSPNVTIENFSAAGKSLGTKLVPRVTKTEDEWRKQLSPAAYGVTRRAGTERAFSGEYAESHGDGLYRCICCDTALYDSRTKFESGTGWPSFWKPISKYNVVESPDNTFGMQRIAISCRRCDAHLGHVFDDGPKPTGLRYCMNSVALRFVKRA
jgi:peptide-methionine (R)-S-oxide reductase